MATAVLHQTDLFHPPSDPDDHWDLACVFALAARGDYDLQGVLIDYPPPWHEGDPAVGAVAQLSRISGVVAPVAVGSASNVRRLHDAGQEFGTSDLIGARFVIDRLRAANAPLSIHVVGSCRDVALAVDLEPGLFADKCAAVYLNAGVSDPEGLGSEVEYNVKVDPEAFARLFDLPCPLRWLPCFDRVERVEASELLHAESGWSTYYSFDQGWVIDRLSESMRRYFAYALDQEPSNRWLRALDSPVRADVYERISRETRNMWSTAGFLLAAGFGVRANGELVPADSADSVFGFVPIEATCDDAGKVTWREAAGSKDSIIQIRDRSAYPDAMRVVLADLLAGL